MSHNVSLHRILDELHASYKPIFASKLLENSSNSKDERSIHREFTSKGFPAHLRPSDFMGSMSAEVCSEWAKDEFMDMEKVQEKLGLAFPLGIYRHEQDKERKTRSDYILCWHTLAKGDKCTQKLFPCVWHS